MSSGATVRPARFSPIMRPQSEAGGWSKSEEANGGCENDRACESDPKVREDRGSNVRQQLSSQNRRRGLAARDRCLNVLVTQQIDCGGARYARDTGSLRDREPDDHKPDLRTDVRKKD